MKISKAVFDLLPAATQALFKANPNNADEFDNGEEHVAGLKSALDRERDEVKRVAQERDALKAAKDAEVAKARQDALKDAREKGDFKAIEDDYKRQLAEANKRAEETAARVDKLTIDNATEGVISQLLPSFVSATAGKAILAGRVKVELVDGQPVTRFLDAAGKPTALDLEGFRKNLLDDSDLKPILVASKGGGGGATSTTGGGGSTSGEKPKDMATASPAEVKAYMLSKGAVAAE